jgi:23S rRNA pseudouridine2605 synthase
MTDQAKSQPESRFEAGPEASSASDGERIAKAMARAGVCSRRDAERLIAEGRVAVNGKVLDRA